MPHRLATVRLADWQESNLHTVISLAFARKAIGNAPTILAKRLLLPPSDPALVLAGLTGA